MPDEQPGCSKAKEELKEAVGDIPNRTRATVTWLSGRSLGCRGRGEKLCEKWQRRETIAHRSGRAGAQAQPSDQWEPHRFWRKTNLHHDSD